DLPGPAPCSPCGPARPARQAGGRSDAPRLRGSDGRIGCNDRRELTLGNLRSPTIVSTTSSPLSAMSPDPDQDLVQASQDAPAQGFDGAFQRLYERYKDRVYNVCFRITGNATDALDASQETFGILYRKIGEFRNHSRFSSWVYRIAV